MQPIVAETGGSTPGSGDDPAVDRVDGLDGVDGVESAACVDRMDPRVERTRRRVVDAVRDLLAEGGIEAVTVHAVAERSGVNKTTVYRNWPEPRTLVHEVLGSIDHRPDLPDQGSVRADLLVLFGRLAASLQRSPWDRLLPSVIGAAAHDPATREFHGAFTRARRDGARVVIDRAVERGELPPATDAAALVETIVGPIYYRVLMTKEEIPPAAVEALVDRALTLFGWHPSGE